MFGECHAHVIMNGKNYKEAVSLHKNGVQDRSIHHCFQEYQKRGITFIRDGGDALGVSARAKELASEYGIDYRSPIFAIHREGHYGSIVGKSYSTMKEYHALILEAKRKGADFIKIMTTGLLDFNNQGKITGTPLPAAEVKELVHIAHGEGMTVMSHTNGVYGVRSAIEAGTDSIEHGNYIDEETIEMLRESGIVWTPTLVTVRNLLGCGRYEDKVLLPIIEIGERNLRFAFEKKVNVALGSDAGAYMVFHGQGICDEYAAFCEILGETEEVRAWIQSGEDIIKERFKR